MIKWLNAWRRCFGDRGGAASLSCAVLLATVSTGYSQEKVLSLGEGAFFSIVWSPNGEFVAASSYDIKAHVEKIVVAETKTEKIVREFKGRPNGGFMALAFSKDSKAVYSLLVRKGETSDIQCWNIETGKEGSALNLPGYGKFLSERFFVSAISPEPKKSECFRFHRQETGYSRGVR